MEEPVRLTVREAFAEAIEHFRAGRLPIAEQLVRGILQVDPRHQQSLRLLAQLTRFAGQPEAALELMEKAQAIVPQMPEVHHEKGTILYGMNRIEEAIASYRRALEIQPDFGQCLSDLGEAEFHCGRPEEATWALEKAKLLKHVDAEVDSRCLRAIRFYAERYPEAVFAQHVSWGERHAEPLKKEIAPHGNERSPERVLKVGYVSGDLFGHAVSFFMESIFAGHDPARVDVHVYADQRVQDAVTGRLRGLVAHWRDITGQRDPQVAEMIRRDGIDILVDLAGHSQWNRMALFARKPAPVQATYLGYPDTTGVKAMDYRITDALCDPPGMTERFYTEKLLRVPAPFVCYRPPEDAPEVAASPAGRGRGITFGSFCVLSKLNQQLMALWSRVLQEVPGSRLMLKGWVLGDAGTRQRIGGAFVARGIAPERLMLLPPIAEMAGHLGAYGEMDVALDTFPYHGTTTTCEAMWMGVPVVTLAGKTHAARVGVSLLNAVGHGEWVAQNEEEYVAIAAGLARDAGKLAGIRGALREEVKSSALVDAARFCRNLEEAFRGIWRERCAPA